MASTVLKFVCFFIFHLLIISFSSSFSAASDKPTVYEILPKYGLPSGLLPDSVTNYTLDEDGYFEVNLKKPCYIKFSYSVYYGIEVQRFFFWFNVDEIKVDLPPSHSIYFSVGIIDKTLDVDQFLNVRSCTGKAALYLKSSVSRCSLSKSFYS
ncbi:hypothetical protein F511_04758 [Dorcoceras hygrometricum]|uniref:Uncharacterized protein n=1 Tax=Dorcoceras hygrometricum TaxID=472368 RepID=A0A2Z7B2E5_9LAMI|nr:hypothetical protein F511_04758 [Dorcoceras hygrometricum]